MLQDHKKNVLTQCITADPHHGPVWQSVAKDPLNVGKDVGQILALVGKAVHETSGAAAI